MSRFETVQATVAARGTGQDRVAVFHDAERTVVVVADGAGGIGDGDAAAETVIREVRTAYANIQTAEQWAAVLRQIDCRITGGESTGIVVEVRCDAVFGASVGDSQAWIVRGENVVDLTAGQTRKPLLGSGQARPTAFSGNALAGTLLVATDGFCNYVKRERLTRAIAQSEFSEIPRRCIELVRLPSGELWDDTTIVACRVRPPMRTRHRYTLDE